MLVFANDALYRPEFVTIEPEVENQTNRIELKLRGIVVTIHMHMRWFIWLVAVEIEPVGSISRNSRHVTISIILPIAQRLAWPTPPVAERQTLTISVDSTARDRPNQSLAAIRAADLAAMFWYAQYGRELMG